MFGNMGNMKELMSLMGNAGQIREKMEAVQKELADKHVEGDAGAGAVRVTANGKLEIVKVELDKTLIGVLTTPLPEEGEPSEDDNKQMIEDLIAAATNDALIKAREMMQQEMSAAAGDFPGLENILKNMPQ